MNSIAPYLDPFHVREGRFQNGIAVFPICRNTSDIDSDITPLSDALRDGFANALETGRMDAINIANDSARRILAIDGETLLGGAQNRIIAGGAVVSTKSSVDVSTACVEVKRWEVPKKGAEILEKNRRFNSCGFAYTELRRLNLAETFHSATVNQSIELNQKKVWENIVRKIVDCEADTKTIDMHDLFTHWESQLAFFATNFPTVTSQCGVMVFSSHSNWFVDLFASREILLGYHAKILKGHALDALMAEEAGTPVSQKRPELKEARERFRGIRVARTLPPLPNHPGVMIFGNQRCHGLALISGGALVHLTACSN